MGADLSRAWLVVIDPQVIFAGEGSDWASPMFPDTVPHLRALAERFPGRVVVTRFVAATEPTGSWADYYRQWPFAMVPDADPLYAVVPQLAGLASDAQVVTEPTFGKWGPALRAVVGEQPHLVLAGVSTDCCVISTALPAADAGATITVATDACAGSTPENHEHALAVMGLYPPQISLATTEQILRG